MGRNIYGTELNKMKSDGEIRQYWEKDHKIDYSDKYYIPRSLMLCEEVKKIFKEKNDISICELGCNVGRNLYYLKKEGYRNLVGTDVNNKMLEKMHITYPKLFNFGYTDIHNLPIEYFLEKVPSNWFELIFTMGVLMHVPDNLIYQVVKDMIRVSKKYILIFELEKNRKKKGDYHWSRRYKHIFEILKAKHLKEINVDKTISPEYLGHLFMK